jgi:Na+-driven multidrug efflux pump
MTVTLAAAFVTAVLDPILIFGFGLGLDGAAISAVVSRLVLAAIGLHGVMVSTACSGASMPRAWRAMRARWARWPGRRC